MIVGQNPGEREDCEGEAFIGPSGELLDDMLRDAGYNTDDVYLTNAVKCITPYEPGTTRRRAPTVDEIDACRVHLTQEIHRVKPEVVIALGDTAMHSLTRQKGISKRRGKELPLHDMFGYECSVFPSYHPAYVLRVPRARPHVTVDLRRVRDRGREKPPVRYGRRLDFPTMQTGLAALDIECIDEQGKIVAQPTQVAIAIEHYGDCWVYDCRYDDFSVIDRLLFKWVHHNGLEFDLPKLGIQPQGYDTEYLAYLVDESQPLNLEALCVKYLGVPGWKEDQYAPLGSNELAEYNARDAINTLALFHVLRAELGDRIKIYERILLPARRALNACSARGLWIDARAVAATRQQVDVSIAIMRDNAIAILKEFLPDEDLRKYNPNSTVQTAAMLRKLGFDLRRKTETGNDKLDKGILSKLGHPFTNALLAYKARTKERSTYVVPYEKAAASGDCRMHNEYTVIRTAVGRTSARNTNVQNLKRELEFFGAPPGACWVKGDYSALHFRLAAWCAGEPAILGRYAADPRWDPHRFFGARFYERPESDVSADQRQIAKSANFSQLYMGDGMTLLNYAAKMGIRLEPWYCNSLHVGWHKTFPMFEPWYQRVWDEIAENGYVETATGRRRHFGDVRLLNASGRFAAHREAVNMKVLGLEPDIALLGLSQCELAGLPINGFFHDAIGFEFDNRSAFEDNKEAIKRCMVDDPLRILREEFGVNITVPLEVDFTVYQGDE